MLKEDRLWVNGPCFFYDTALFPPGTDSFALGYFAVPKRGDAVCDLGSGVGILGALLLAREPDIRLANVELSPDAMALAERTFSANGWADRVSFHLGDLRSRACLPSSGSIDCCVSNPPYFKSGSGKSCPDAARRCAREESHASIDDICAAAQYLLRWGGRLSVVYRPDRLVDLLCAMRTHGIEPKRLRYLLPRSDAAPSLLLIEGRRGGKPGLITQPPLVIGNREWDAVYFR